MYLKMTLLDKKNAIKLINSWAKIKEIALIYWVSSPTICNLINNKHKKLIMKEKQEELKKEKDAHQHYYVEQRIKKEEQEKLILEEKRQLLIKIEQDRLELISKSNYYLDESLDTNYYH